MVASHPNPTGTSCAAFSTTTPEPVVTVVFSDESRWPTVRAGGRALHSRRDPETEAARWAEATLAELNPPRGDAIVVFGGGWGWHAQALAARWSGTLFVHEPFVALRPATGTHADRRPWGAGTPPYQPLDGAQDEVALGHALQAGATLHYAALPVYARLLSAERDALRLRLERLVAEVALYARTTRMRAAEWAEHSFANAPRLLDCHPVSALDGATPGQPVFLVAAGPSLDRNVAQLADAAERGVVIAVNHALGALHRAGVRPDLVVSIEGRDVSGHFAVPTDYYERQLLATMAHPALFALPHRVRFVGHIAEDLVARLLLGALGDDALVAAGGSVATLAFGVAARMGADPIVLVGQDLAYTGQRGYAAGSRRDDMRLERSPDGRATLVRGTDEMDQPEHGAHITDTVELLEVPGWDGGTVPTSYALDAQRLWLERAIDGLDAGKRVINATEGGAHIAGAEHTPLADVLAALPVHAADKTMLEPPARDARSRQRQLKRFVTQRRRRLTTAVDRVTSGERQLRRLENAPDGDRERLLAAFARTDTAVGGAMAPFHELDAYLAQHGTPAAEATSELTQTRTTYTQVAEAGRTVVERFRTLETTLSAKRPARRDDTHRDGAGRTRRSTSG